MGPRKFQNISATKNAKIRGTSCLLCNIIYEENVVPTLYCWQFGFPLMCDVDLYMPWYFCEAAKWHIRLLYRSFRNLKHFCLSSYYIYLVLLKFICGAVEGLYIEYINAKLEMSLFEKKGNGD